MVMNRSTHFDIDTCVLDVLFYSHLVTCQPGPLLSEAILSSPILSGEDGAPIAPGFEFGIDPSEDPELAMVRLVLCTMDVFVFTELDFRRCECPWRSRG